MTTGQMAIDTQVYYRANF